jgi:hypothetical protein
VVRALGGHSVGRSLNNGNEAWEEAWREREKAPGPADMERGQTWNRNLELELEPGLLACWTLSKQHPGLDDFDHHAT